MSRSTGLTRRSALGALTVATAVATEGATAAAQPAGRGGPVTLLYPHESATRRTRDLSGLWRFKLDPKDEGARGRWSEGLGDGTRRIPVPCSWNDLFDDASEYFGPAWYETEVWCDALPAGRRVLLRFGAASYHADVWLNGRSLGAHEGGHLPFAFDATDALLPGRANRLVVRVENELRVDRVPASGDHQAFHFTQDDYPPTTYDFFPYAGLHRPVHLQTLPPTHLRDLTVTTTALSPDQASVRVSVEVSGGWSGSVDLRLDGGPAPALARAQVRDGRGEAELTLPHPRAWSPEDPFLHRLTVSVGGEARPLDVYALKVGLRTIAVRGSQILLNGKPVFLKGFGKHEDFAVHGKGPRPARAGPRLRTPEVARRQQLPHLALPLRGGGDDAGRRVWPAGDRRGSRRLLCVRRHAAGGGGARRAAGAGAGRTRPPGQEPRLRDPVVDRQRADPEALPHQ